MIEYTIKITKMVRIFTEDYEPEKALKLAISEEEGLVLDEVHAEIIGEPKMT